MFSKLKTFLSVAGLPQKGSSAIYFALMRWAFCGIIFTSNGKVVFCEKQNIQLPVPFIEAEFNMCVQSLERTFVDKVFAVCDYKLQNMMDRDSRHLYDIAKIYPHISIDDDFKKFIKLVRADRIKSKNNPSAKEQYDINELLKDIIETRFFEKDYNFLTTKLLYEEYSYDLAVITGIDKVRNLNIF